MGTHRMLFRDATDALGVSLATISDAIGRSYATVAAYRVGERQPPAEVWRDLATFAREHSAHIRETAREIAEVAREAERTERSANSSRLAVYRKR